MESSNPKPNYQSNQQYYQGQNQNQYHQKRGNYRGGRGNYRQNNYRNQNSNYRGNYYQNYPQYHQQPFQREYVNPYIAQKMIYLTEMYIYTKYRHLININTTNQGLSKQITDASTFYVIKSFSEEDVHKSIKYGVWSSSKNGNQTLTNSFKLTQEKKGDIYLFFS